MFFAHGFFFPDFYVGKQVQLKGKAKIKLAENARVSDYSILNTYPNPNGNPYRKKYAKGEITIGKNTNIKNNVQLYTYNGFITIGNNCTVNPNCILYGESGITIGNNVLMAAGTTIVASNHVFKDPNILIRKQGITTEGISIGNDVWIAANCVIVDGAIIPDGVVVGANSLVRGELEPYCIYGGSPVKKIKERKA